MPFNFKFDKPAMGYAASSARAGEENVKVVTREFLSFEDGAKFIQHLEGWASTLIDRIPPEAGIRCSTVDHLVAHHDRNGNTTVYVNELEQIAKAQINRAVNAGDAIHEDDIVGIERLEFGRLEIPADHGVLVLFSRGWRKGLYFDFSPLVPGASPRTYDLWEVIGQYYTYLTYQEIFRLTEDDWAKLFQAQWFPFVGIPLDKLKLVIAGVREGWSVTDWLPQIAPVIKGRIAEMISAWKTRAEFSDHIAFFDKAAERFLQDDYLSASSIIFPRIEGLLRTISLTTTNPRFRQADLAAISRQKLADTSKTISRVFPDRFSIYLEKVYFASFSPDRKAETISRNSVGHGVAPLQLFNEEAALLGFLVIHQIFFHLPATKSLLGDEVAA